MQDHVFLTKAAYLRDFFSDVSALNVPLQGNQSLVPITTGKVVGFKTTLELYARRINDGDKSVFPELTEWYGSGSGHTGQCLFRGEISAHLVTATQAIEEYFPGLAKRGSDAWIMRPFTVPENTIPDNLVQMKLEFLRLREDNRLRTDFQDGENLVTFWATQREDYSQLAVEALQFLSRPHQRKAGFSVMLTTNTKSRNRLVIDGDLEVSLHYLCSTVQPFDDSEAVSGLSIMFLGI